MAVSRRLLDSHCVAFLVDPHRYSKVLAYLCVRHMGSFAPAYLTGRFIDEVVRPYQAGALSRPEAVRLAWVIVALLGTAYVLREAFAWVRFRTMSMLGELVARDRREQIYQHLHGLSVSFFSSMQTGSIINRVSSDTVRIWDFVAFGMVKAFHQEEPEKKRFRRRKGDVTGEFNLIHVTWTSFWPVLMLSIQAVMLGVWLCALPRVLAHGGDQDVVPLSAGTFVSFLVYMTQFTQPIEVIGLVGPSGSG